MSHYYVTQISQISQIFQVTDNATQVDLHRFTDASVLPSAEKSVRSNLRLRRKNL